MIKKNFLFILNIDKIATSKNLLKLLGNNVNDKADPFKLILVYDVIMAHVLRREFLSWQIPAGRKVEFHFRSQDASTS